ncbi:MAG: hypothetical protein JWQ10_3691 [Herbaspirillum sp.]|nr:hypothetical protein [Herbaspirillum sp.]
MQFVNTSNLSATSPAWLSASTGPVSKNDLDIVISVADKPMHPEMTGAISELAGDYVLLAETTLALIGSDQKRQPETDEKEASDLARLKNLKADTEQTLKGSVVHLDFSEGAMEMKLIKLSLELSALIDKLLKGRMESQRGRNQQIEVLNNLLSELRKHEKSTEAFDPASLDKAIYTATPESLSRGINRMREKMASGKAAAAATARAEYIEVLKWSVSFRGATGYYRKHIAAENAGFGISIDGDADGNFIYWNKDKSDSRTLRPATSVFYPSWGPDKVKHAFFTEKEADKNIEKKFNDYVASGKVSLNALLLGYDVYKAGEKLPVTKEDLEAATEKISSMVNSINSTQGLKMLDIHKFTNGRNEAYDLAVKVNNTKLDSLNALIKMIGER